MKYLINAAQNTTQNLGAATLDGYEYTTRASIGHPHCGIDGRNGPVFIETLDWAITPKIQLVKAPVIILRHDFRRAIPTIAYTASTKQLAIVTHGESLKHIQHELDTHQALLYDANEILRMSAEEDQAAVMNMRHYLDKHRGKYPVLTFGLSGSDAYLGWLQTLIDAKWDETPTFDSRTVS